MNISNYIKDFCGEDHFFIWDKSHHNFGLCFQKFVLCGISYTLLAICSAFYIGKNSSSLIRNKTQKAIIIVRFIISLILLLLAILKPCLMSFYAHVKIFWVDILISSAQVLAWTIHLVYLFSLKCGLSQGTRGPKPVLIVWILTLVCCILSAKTSWSISYVFPQDSREYLFSLHLVQYLVTLQLAFQVFYLLTLFPHGRNEMHYRVDQDTPFGISSPPSYSRFHEVFDPFHLGTAEERVNSLSYLTFHWVNLMMEKGNNGLLKNVDDLYDLPDALHCKVVAQLVQRQILLSRPLSLEMEMTMSRQKYVLFRALHKCFGNRFYSIGFIKLASDILSFFSPLLLNVVVQFVEGKENIKAWHGYTAGFGMCLFTLLSSFLIVHFNYFMAKISLQLRAAIISTVFKKFQHLSVVNLSKFSSGEIVNMMSTDTDRVINFSQSFHALWSLPFQLTITLFLLYQQIGIAFLAGIILAIILIPANRLIAVKIAYLSTQMMHFKDKRLAFVTDILSKIKEIKLNSWENLFKRKVMDERYCEMQALSARKYLDALCVYLWASNPVLIPIITFGTYYVLGNEMEASKVFTAIALLNMMVAPLNAFPWVINGLVEAWVSMKRIEKLMQSEEYNYDDFYTVVPNEGYIEADVQVLLLNANFAWTKACDVALSESSTNQVKAQSGLNYSEESMSLPSNPIYSEPSFSLPPNLPRLILQDINLQLSKCQVIAIVGKVGSGKTSLLYAILGELEKVSGVVSVATLHQGFGFASQEPWLQNISIKENITFGSNFDPSKYRSVIQSCSLEDDFKHLMKGDGTRCGENGSLLSGGQRARVALARAVYQNRNIYMLDDVLSAVDIPVANHIMQHCIHGLLAGCTVIIVTHHYHLLKPEDWIIEMDEGRIKRQGPAWEVLPHLDQSGSTYIAKSHIVSSGAILRKSYKHNKLVQKSSKEGLKVPLLEQDSGQQTEEMEPETRSFGELNTAIYTTYFSSCGFLLAVLVFLSFLLMQGSRNLIDVWLAKWVSHDDHLNWTSGVLTRDNKIGQTSYKVYPLWRYFLYPFQQNVSSFLPSTYQSTKLDASAVYLPDSEDVYWTDELYFIVYVILAATNSMFTLMRAFLFAYAGICTAKVLHKKLLESVIYSKICFFNLNSAGRILNRFSTDIFTIDDTLPFQANILFAQVFGLLGTLIITIYGLPWITLLYIPLFFIYYTVQQYYRHTSRELRRIYNITLSPLYTHFTENLQGLSVIRALRATHRFGLMLDGYLEQNQRAHFGLVISSQWLSLRLQLIGLGILAGSVLLALWEHHITGIDAGMVGLVISYALTISGALNGVVTYLTETERELISVERVHQYLVSIVREGQNESFLNSFSGTTQAIVSPPIALPFGWPNQGLIRFENVYLKYHDHNPYCLHNITLTINPREKVGIVGRTGAGKSSLFMALFRLIELSRGKIFIDSVDISEISLKKLRTSMAVVTQDALLFIGSVRENLDPRGENSDEEIVSVMDECELSHLLANPDHLDSPLQTRKLSAGEKQLLCLARALLSRAQIICIDEGTGLLDKETESRVTRVMKEAFLNKTVLIIAHRVPVIKLCDRIIVISDGEIIEMGRPSDFIDDANYIQGSINDA